MATLPNVASLDTISAAWANSVIAQVNAHDASINGLAVVTFPVALGSNVIAAGGSVLQVYRIGKLCLLDGLTQVTIPMTAQATMTLGTVPAAVRPTRTIPSTARYVGGGNAENVIVPCVIQTSGLIQSVGPAQGANSEVHVNAVCWTIP